MNVACRTILTPFKQPTLTLFRNYAFKSDLKIKWVRPEKIPQYKPEKSGDLSGVPPIDKTQLQWEYRDSKELQDAEPNIRKLFTLEFGTNSRTQLLYRHNFVDEIKRHNYDVASVEVKIAKWTAIIRSYQQMMARFPRNKRLKVVLQELIDKRKKQLKYLRRWDYKRFEWLLEALNIVYKSPPDQYIAVTRKQSLVKLTNEYCDTVRNEKLATYRSLLENEQPTFLQEKIRSLEFIRDEQKQCGVPVTVTQEEIDATKKQLSELLEQRKSGENDD